MNQIKGYSMLQRNLKYLRQSENLTYEDFAHLLDVKVDIVKSWETGNLKPSLEQIGLIAAIFKIEFDRLYTDDFESLKNKTLNNVGEENLVNLNTNINSKSNGTRLKSFGYCTNCGSELKEDADGCINCGKLVNNFNKVEISSKLPNLKYCSNCGFEVHHNADLCLNCGKFINSKKITTSDSKSKIVAGLLALFIGSIGIHNFYLGDNKNGIIHLVLFFVGFLTFGITTFITSLWALIEAITIFTSTNAVDFNGNPLI